MGYEDKSKGHFEIFLEGMLRELDLLVLLRYFYLEAKMETTFIAIDRK
jgi:hypothetical protein